mmetsp:Transcript_8886/g.16339  ORF Transcript_8886/g.16339 Transcript_8886/m.16339 type:complete len:674 (-) Transcript_8886:222-2243(-)
MSFDPHLLVGLGDDGEDITFPSSSSSAMPAHRRETKKTTTDNNNIDNNGNNSSKNAKTGGSREAEEIGTFWEAAGASGDAGGEMEAAASTSASSRGAEPEGGSDRGGGSGGDAVGSGGEQLADTNNCNNNSNTDAPPRARKAADQNGELSSAFSLTNKALVSGGSKETTPSKVEAGGAATATDGKWKLLNILNPFGAAAEGGGGSGTGAVKAVAEAGHNNNTSDNSTSSTSKGAEKDASSSKKAVRFTYGDFIEKLRKPQAKPQARRLNLFVKQYMAQASIGDGEMNRIHRFILEAHVGIAQNVLWKNASAKELDNVFESLEKCILLKLYSKIFFAGYAEQKDDRALQKKVFCHQFLQPENLDIKDIYYDAPVWELAQGELKRMNQYKAPRDKIVCLLNCCKMILNLLKTVKEKQIGADTMEPEELKRQQGLLPSADDFLPILIYMVIKAQVPHLHLNIRYIEIARHPRKLAGESAYYFTNLKSAVAFIERLSPEVLSIDPDKYKSSIAAAKQKWDEREKKQKLLQQQQQQQQQQNEHKQHKKHPQNSPSLQSTPKKNKNSSNKNTPNANSEQGLPGTHTTPEPAAAAAPARADGGSKADIKMRLSPANFRFINVASAGELRVGDLPKLLEDYKRMANILIRLSASGRRDASSSAASTSASSSRGSMFGFFTS